MLGDGCPTQSLTGPLGASRWGPAQKHHVPAPPSPPPPPPPTKDCQEFSGFIASPKADHNGDDIARIPGLTMAAKACLQAPMCKGFNSNGYIKKAAAPLVSASTCFYTKILT
ncbi:hypothetical protein Vafri_22146 [Volvox africanus]|uniref:Uncharacterized protein n=1 Tax=Volvox africanus TaxID=51714 RepID=A0A8J4BX02_9CHLO|nr:hypothetical protein Vafri_22146 [Volvox africanus]